MNPNSGSDIVLYEYYGLKVVLNSQDPLPVHVYATFGETRAMAEILFKNGIHKENRIVPVDGFEMPDPDEIQNFIKILDSWLPDVLKAWQDTFIFRKKVHPEAILEKI